MLKIMKYPGAKTVIVPEISELYKSSGCNTFIDVFSGSGSVIININAEKKVYNDINPDLYNLFKSLKSNFNDIAIPMERLSEDRNSFFEFYDNKILFNSENKDTENAFNILFKLNTGFGGMGNTYTKKDKSLYGNFKKNVNDLFKARDTIKNMEIKNLDFRDLFKSYDSGKNFFYIDPPYPGKEWYQYNFTRADYKDLSEIINKLNGKYAMTFNSGNSDIYSIFGRPSFIKKYENKNGNDNSFRIIDFYTNLLLK